MSPQSKRVPAAVLKGTHGDWKGRNWNATVKEMDDHGNYKVRYDKSGDRFSVCVCFKNDVAFLMA